MLHAASLQHVQPARLPAPEAVLADGMDDIPAPTGLAYGPQVPADAGGQQRSVLAVGASAPEQRRPPRHQHTQRRRRRQ